MKFETLCCHGRVAPLDVDIRRPILSWRMQAGDGYLQQSYRVWVASSVSLLEQGKADLWDSGVVQRPESVDIVYGGVPLRSRQRCYWKVRVCGNSGEAESPVSFWEMALLEPSDWDAEWIGYPPGTDGGALYFRRAFSVKGDVAYARLYACGLGYSQWRLNGRQIGEDVLDPAWTAYDKRVLYRVFDVSKELKAGRNVLAAVVGNGWYGMPKLRAQLEIFYRDGRRQSVSSRSGHTEAPETWMIGHGPVRANSVYGGEIYDAQMECPDWDSAQTAPANFVVAMSVDAPAGEMRTQGVEPIRVVERFAPGRIFSPKRGVCVFDAGENLSGWAGVRIHAPRGYRLRLRYAETLGKDGCISRGTLREAPAEDIYICSGNGCEYWEPRFTYHGFRYVQIDGLPQSPTADTATICRVRSDLKKTGEFECSNELINRIEQAVLRTEASNLHGLPTDCPQRDERLGWLNDMTVRMEEAIYHFDMEQLLEKWCGDIVDTQCVQTGSITDTAPFMWGKRPADPVSESLLLAPWMNYLHYGSAELMRRYYGNMVKWVEFLIRQTRDGILEYSSWGDWAPPEAFALQDSVGGGAVSKYTPGALVSTAYLCHQGQLLARMARILGRLSEAKRWRLFAERTAKSFHKKFWNPDGRGYGSGKQACNLLALRVGLVPSELREQVVQALLADIDSTGDHPNTGNLCSKYLLEVLTESGYVNRAFKIATQTTYPSWGYMLSQGATTIWERWENKIDGEMNSHNHPMLGAVSAWFFKYLAGLRPNPEAPGWRHFDIRPYIPKSLNRVRASHWCRYGKIEVRWEFSGKKFVMETEIPPNTCGRIFVPLSNESQKVRLVAARKGRNASRPVERQRSNGFAIFEAKAGKYVFETSLSGK